MANYEITTKAGATYRLDLPDAMSETEVMDYFNNRYLPSLEQDVYSPSINEPSGDLSQFNRLVESPTNQPIPDQANFKLTAPNQEKTPESNQPIGDTARGFEQSFTQWPELGYGVKAGAYALGEMVAGEGGMMTQGKKQAVESMIAASKENEALSRPSDSPTQAWEMAKQGDIGALADMVQYGIGYGAGQGLQAIVTGGLGSVTAKAATSIFAKEYTAKLVEQEIAKISEKSLAEGLTQDQIAKQATANVADNIATKGATVAMGAQATGMEGGEIMGDVAKQSVEQNRAITPWEAIRGIGATAAASYFEFLADKFNFDVITGKKTSAFGEATEGLKGRLQRGIGLGAEGATREGLTEFAQTLIEEGGKGADPFSSDSFKQAVDSAILGFIGGGAISGSAGALSGAKPATTAQEAQGQTTAEPAQTSADWNKTMGDIRNIVGENQLDIKPTPPQENAPATSTNINDDFIKNAIKNGAQLTDNGLQLITGEIYPLDRNQRNTVIDIIDNNLNNIMGNTAPIVDNEIIVNDVINSNTLDDALQTFNNTVEANTYGHQVNMDYANKIADRFKSNKEIQINDKDYQDAVQLEQQLSTVREELAYNKFKTAFEESNRRASREEFNALIEQEINDKNQQLKNLIQYQSEERAKKAEESVPSTNKMLEDAQWVKTRNNRNAVIQMVFDRGLPAEHIFPAIKAELKRQGFRDTQISQDDVNAYELLRSTYGRYESEIAKEPVAFDVNAIDQSGIVQGQDVVTNFVEPTTPLRQEADSLRKVDEWVNNGATYKNGMLVDSKGKKFILNNAQRDYYLTNRPFQLNKNTIELPKQGYSENRQGQDTVTGIPSFNTKILKEVLDTQIKERIANNIESRNISSINQRIEDAQWIQTRNNRNAAIQTVFDKNIPVTHIESAIKAELKRQGFKDTELSEDDLNAYELLRSTYGRYESQIAKEPVAFNISSKKQIPQSKQGQDVITNFVEPTTPLKNENDILRKVDEWVNNGASYKNGTLIDSKGKKFILNKAQRDYYLNKRSFPVAKEPVAMGEQLPSTTQRGVDQITGVIEKPKTPTNQEPVAQTPVVNKQNNLNKITGLEPIEVAIGKLGGINREIANREGFSDYKGRYFNSKSTQSFDGMAEILRGYGYEVEGGNDLVAQLDKSLRAEKGSIHKVYTAQGYDHIMNLQQIEEFKEFEAEQKELAKELSKVALGNPSIIEEIHLAETPEDFDNLLSNIVTLSEDEADDFWNSIGEENADQTTKDASIATIKENAPEILSTYTQQEVTQREEAQKAAEKEQAVKDAAAERKRQADNQVDSVVDEMLGRGMTTTKDIFAPERKPKFSKAKAQERLAPNGKPSNLNATQYEQVRTPEFKAWFGDWENDPENASKVVDENGEPLVVYHKTNKDFTTFDPNKSIDGWGIHFGTKQAAEDLVKSGTGEGNYLMPVFLNIREVVHTDYDAGRWGLPQLKDAWETYWSNLPNKIKRRILKNQESDGMRTDMGNAYGKFMYYKAIDAVDLTDKEANKLMADGLAKYGMDGISYKNAFEDKGTTSYIVMDSNQVKSATGNIGAFSKESNDIRFSKEQSATDNNHTEQSLKEGLTQSGDDAYGKGWTDRLFATGKFEIISDADTQVIIKEAAEISYSKNGDIEAFFNPNDGKTYFVAENIDKATDLHYLMMHEVGVHALNMGGNKAEFESILKQVDNLVKVKNPAAMKGRQDALDAGTPQEDLREETLAYLLKYAPKLKIVERFKAWLKNALRNMGKSFPAAQRSGFIQWANKLSDQDLLYIADATLRKAPEMLSKSTQPQYESDAILAAKAENRALIVGNLERLKDENPDAHQAVMDYLDRIPEDELKRVSDNLEEFKGTPWAMVAVKSMVIRQIYHLSENYEANKDAIDKLTTGTLWGKDDISRYATLKVFLGKDREKKIKLLANAYDFVGDNRKAENDVAGSFINCDPSKACAEHCYAALANGRPAELLKAEYTEYMASKYPEILANRIYDQYSLTAAFKEKLTLRLNDKGELSPAQLKVIELLNEKGVVLQIFSKRPELLKQVDDRNLKMLSIDTTNFDLAINNPEFKLAITLTDNFTPEMIAKVDDRVAVYLPVNLKGKEWSREKLREMYPEKYKDMSKRICPVDGASLDTKTGTSFVQVLNKEAKGLWTCTTCDKLGTVGCFKGFNKEKAAKYVSASSIGNLSKERALAKKQDDISSMLSEFKQMEGIDDDTYRKIIELLSKRPSELSESNERIGDSTTENKNIKQAGGNVQEGTGTGETTGTTSNSLKFSKKSKEGEILNRTTGYANYENAKPIPEEVDNKDNYPEGVSLEEEHDWMMQQLRRFDSFRRLNDKSNELINKYLTTMGRLPELGKYLGMRYQTLGKIDNVDDIVRNVFETLRTASKEDSKEIYTYLTDNKATTEFIHDPKMALMAKDLKEAITIIGKKLVEFNIIPMESFQMYEGRYLPRVYLEHIIQSSDRYQSLGSGKTLSPMGYAKKRNNNLPEEFRRLIKGEVKNTAYLASRTLSIPLRDIAMMEFFNQISNNEKWVWKQSLINIELDAKTNRPTAIFDDDGVINYKATNTALEGKPKKIVLRKVTPYFLDKEADRILDQSYSVPEEDRKDMQDLAHMMKRAAAKAMVNMDAIPSDFIKMPNVAKYGSLRGLVVHKLIYDDLVGTINTYGATGEQTALENFFGNNGILARITSAFKFTHVAVNIPTQVMNLLSNGLLLHLSGVRFDKVPVRVTQAFREVLNDGENYKRMVAMGGRKATFSNQELKGITDWLLENEAEFSDKNTDWFSIVHIMRELSYLAGKTVRSANNLHQNIEMIFKVAKFIDMKSKGANDETAAVMAHQALFDYSFIPRWAKWLRTVPMGIPFITWTIKSFESTLRTVANRPTAFLPYYMLGYAMSLAAAADFGDDGEDKLKAILKLLPERMQRGGNIWILPIKDDSGRTQFIDMKNLFPWGKTAEAVDSLSKLVGNQDVTEIRNLADSIGVFSSPITQAVVAIDTNKDAFTGKPIVDENDTSAAKLQSILEYTYGMMMPPMLGAKGDIATIYKSQFPSEYEGIMNKDGSPKKTETQAFIHLFSGISVKSVDVDFERQKRIDAFNNMITGIKAQRTRELHANPNLNDEERQNVRDKYDARIERVREKKQKFIDETDVLTK